MASALAVDKLGSQICVDVRDSGDASTAKVVSPYYDMRDYTDLLALVRAHTLTGVGLTVLRWYAAATAADSSAEIISDAAVQIAAGAPDAVGDQIQLQASAAQVRSVGDAAGKVLRYAFLKATAANSADRLSCVTVAKAVKAGEGTTADYIA